MMNKTNPIFRGILDEAQAAGREAAARHTPTPMGVFNSDLAGNRLGPTEIVADGVCGFAWVRIKGNTAFGRWAKKERLAFNDYPSGLLLRLEGDYGQGLERKEKHAEAMARVLKSHGIDAYAKARMD
jgi:hypothetical protein